MAPRLRIAELREEVERLGWPAVVGAGLAALAAALYFSAVVPLADEGARLRGEAEDLQRRYRTGDALARDKPGSAEQLATFYAFFPAPRSSPEWLGKIHAAAQAKGLQLNVGEYKLERRPDSKIARYQITLPVQGTYAQVRSFVGEVLKAVPAAALDDITLRRESVDSPKVEARIRLTLYLGNA
jgi:Tfp pilus assembly protein PilO